MLLLHTLNRLIDGHGSEIGLVGQGRSARYLPDRRTPCLYPTSFAVLAVDIGLCHGAKASQRRGQARPSAPLAP